MSCLGQPICIINWITAHNSVALPFEGLTRNASKENKFHLAEVFCIVKVYRVPNISAAEKEFFQEV